jgi:hypothetical protein
MRWIRRIPFPFLPSAVVTAGLLAIVSIGLPGLSDPGEAQDPPGEPRLLDRIVAVVDQDPIYQSEVEQVIELGLVEPEEGESAEALRRRVLSDLVDRRLRYREVGRFGTRTVTVDQIDQAVAEMRAGYPTEEAFEKRLRESNTTLDELRQIVARQLAVVDYVDRRLGPRVFVSLEDIQTYYDEELAPALRKQGTEPPPLNEVRETIRGVLRERRLNEEIERWTRDLRREADVQILIDDYPDELPPVRLTIQQPLREGSEKGERRRTGKRPKTPKDGS